MPPRTSTGRSRSCGGWKTRTGRTGIGGEQLAPGEAISVRSDAQLLSGSDDVRGKPLVAN